MTVLIIATLSLTIVSLPARARALVIEWVSIHQEELRDADPYLESRVNRATNSRDHRIFSFVTL